MKGERRDTCTARVLAGCGAPGPGWKKHGGLDHTTSDRRDVQATEFRSSSQSFLHASKHQWSGRGMGWDPKRMEPWWWLSGSVGSEGLNCVTRAINHSENSTDALLEALAFLGTLTASPERAGASKSHQWFSAVWPTALHPSDSSGVPHPHALCGQNLPGA